MVEGVVERRRFGKTNLYVTELSYGAMNLRQLDTIEEAYEILDYVLHQGINLIDTARAYNGINGQGQKVESEELVGNAISNYDDLDEPIVVITKGHGYEIKQLEEELETSLNKLGVKGKHSLKIGDNDIKLVYLFHGINENRWETMTSSGVLDRARQLKAQGIINFIGFSSHYAQKDTIKKALDTNIFDVVELPYNIFNRSLGEDGGDRNLLKYAYEKDVGIINMKAFNGNGMNSIYEIIKDYVSIGYQSMLNFCLANPYISTVDAGAKYISEFKQDLKTALGTRLSQSQIESLKKEADKVSPYMSDICRECMHCMEKFECNQKIDFPGILSLYSRYLISKKLDRQIAEFKKEYQEFDLNATDCTECGECLEWCEYDLEIPEMLSRAHQELKD